MSNDQRKLPPVVNYNKVVSAILAKKFDRWGEIAIFKVAIFKVAIFKVAVGYL
jgi:hypothetical protein